MGHKRLEKKAEEGGYLEMPLNWKWMLDILPQNCIVLQFECFADHVAH